MKIQNKFLHTYNPLWLATAVLLGTAVLILNLFILDVLPATLLLYGAGSLFYFLVDFSGNADDSGKVGYLLSGKAAAGTLAIIVTGRFISDNPIAICAGTLCFMIALEYYMHYCLQCGERELLMYGTGLNLLLAIVVLFLVFRDPGFSLKHLESAVLSVFSTSQRSPVVPLAFLASGSALMVLLYRSYPEITALSYGKTYFQNTGRNYTLWYGLLVIVRGALLSTALLLLGWMGGFLPIIAGRYRKRGFPLLIHFFSFTVYTYLIYFLSIRLDYTAIMGISYGSALALYFRQIHLRRKGYD